MKHAVWRLWRLWPLCYTDSMGMGRLGHLACLVLSLAAPISARAITSGQVDNFQDGTTNGWANGGAAAQPVNVATGGPGGAGDRYLQVTSDGAGANGRMTVFNRVQWLGDYVANGVFGIELDLRNFGNTNLNIRLAFKDGTGISASGYLTNAFSLATGSGWQHVFFAIDPGSVTAVGTPADYATFFSNPAELRIINEAGATDLNGTSVIGQIGVDNIHAVPEPGATLLLASGGAVLALARLRSVRSNR